MGDRAFGAMMFVFAAPNTLPVNAPGVSVVLGIPLLFLSLQLMLGFAVPWLPRALVAGDGHAAAVRARHERRRAVDAAGREAVRTALAAAAAGLAERLIGLVCVVLSVVLILPVPFGNMGPGVAMCILAFALLERDGKATLAGLVVAAIALALAWGVILAIVKTVSLLVRHWLGI